MSLSEVQILSIQNLKTYLLRQPHCISFARAASHDVQKITAVYVEEHLKMMCAESRFS